MMPDALWLRERCGIIGAMVGGVATFKQQNVVRGLPLQLSPEELTLALENRWVTLAPAILGASTTLPFHPDGGGQGVRLGFGSAIDDDDDDDDDDDSYDQPPGDEEATIWQDCLANGSLFSIPITPEEAAAASRPVNQGDKPFLSESKGLGDSSNETNGRNRSKADNATLPDWTFPSTEEEKHRYVVFRDMHMRGYRMTGGLKFGADYLVYPGDPTIFHAQLCVRLLPAGKPILPIMLASACRGSFQARKHLLIASVIEVQEPRKGQPEERSNVTQLNGSYYKILYMTFGPVDGFG